MLLLGLTFLAFVTSSECHRFSVISSCGFLKVKNENDCPLMKLFLGWSTQQNILLSLEANLVGGRCLVVYPILLFSLPLAMRSPCMAEIWSTGTVSLNSNAQTNCYHLRKSHIIWASASSVVCEQQKRRPACASAQSDQRLCHSLIVKYHIQT